LISGGPNLSMKLVQKRLTINDLKFGSPRKSTHIKINGLVFLNRVWNFTSKRTHKFLSSTASRTSHVRSSASARPLPGCVAALCWFL